MAVIRAILIILNILFASILMFFVASMDKSKDNTAAYFGFGYMIAIVLFNAAYIMFVP